MSWEETAKDYYKEIQTLHGEMDAALSKLKMGMPRTFENAIHILEKSLAESEKSVTMMKRMEP